MGIIVRSIPLESIYIGSVNDVGTIRVLDLLFCISTEELKSEPLFALEKVYVPPKHTYMKDTKH